MDEQAFTRTAHEYGARLYVVAYRLLGNRADAEDAVQRALLKCFAARASYSPQWAISTWLYRALTNVCIDELRRRRSRSAALQGSAEIGARHAAAGTAAERVDVERALARVPREARVLLALHYVDGLSFGELARVRGISVNTVKSQLARGKAIMRKALAARGGRRASGGSDDG
jgi:RNA polymerase sigma-70 factor, ECF subfamily